MQTNLKLDGKVYSLGSLSLLVIGSVNECQHRLKNGFQMAVEKPTPNYLLRPTTTGANSAMNQSVFLAITRNLLQATEKSRVQSAIGIGFGSH